MGYTLYDLRLSSKARGSRSALERHGPGVERGGRYNALSGHSDHNRVRPCGVGAFNHNIVGQPVAFAWLCCLAFRRWAVCRYSSFSGAF